MNIPHQIKSLMPVTRRGDPTGHVRMSVSERRQNRRGELSLEASLKINNETYSAEILDISSGGARLRCSVVPRNGASIAISLDGFADLPAVVIRRLPTAIAVEFRLPPLQYAEFSERLDRMLKAHA